MNNRWDDVEDLLVACAQDDLEDTGEVQPALVAFAGDALRFIAWLRPFAKGAYAEPLIELFALAAPLDADRLAVSVAGRAWSLEDPIPPVSADADLRQRILLLHRCDGASGTLRARSTLHAFDLTADGVAWGERHELGSGEGWIPRALEVAIRTRDRLRAPDAEIGRQARRVVELGHALHVAPDVAHRPEAAPPPPRPRTTS